MAVELVEIVNPTTGRKGFVAATSRAAAAYKQPPSARTPAPNEAAGHAEQQTVDTHPPTGPEKPGKNGSKDEWVAYATHTATPNGLSSETADQMNRDDLVAHFETVQED